MKNAINVGIIILFVSLMASCAGTVTIAPPPPPVETVIVRPSPRHVWVPGHYAYRGRRYVWVDGYHTIPPRGRSAYAPGEWRQSPRGYVWVEGRWN